MAIEPGKRSAVIIAAFGFVVVAGAFLGLVSRSPRSNPARQFVVTEQVRDAIQLVIQQDRQAAQETLTRRTNHVTSYFGGSVAVRGDAPAEVKVRDYLARARQIEMDGCPEDLRFAYLLHIQAWEKKLHSLQQGGHG